MRLTNYGHINIDWEKFYDRSRAMCADSNTWYDLLDESKIGRVGSVSLDMREIYWGFFVHESELYFVEGMSEYEYDTLVKIETADALLEMITVLMI